MGSINRPEDAEEVSKQQDASPRPSSQADDAERLSVSSRQRIRDQMQADIDAFLAQGGTIEKLDITMSAEKLNQQ